MRHACVLLLPLILFYFHHHHQKTSSSFSPFPTYSVLFFFLVLFFSIIQMLNSNGPTDVKAMLIIFNLCVRVYVFFLREYNKFGAQFLPSASIYLNFICVLIDCVDQSAFALAFNGFVSIDWCDALNIRLFYKSKCIECVFVYVACCFFFLFYFGTNLLIL